MNKENLFKNIGKAILIFLLFNYSWLFQVIPIAMFDINVKLLDDKAGVFLSAFSSLCICIILCIIYKDDLKKEFKTFKANFWKNFDIGSKYWFIGLVSMIVINNIIINVLSGGQAANEEAVQGMISSLPWMMLFTAGLLAPISEEIVFRKSIRNIFTNKWLYIITSGLLFGLAHVLGNTTVWTDWLYVLSYGSLGSAFAASYYKTDTIFTPILFHIIHNFVLVILSII